MEKGTKNRNEIVYLDDNGREVDKSKATRCKIMEYDKAGNLVNTTYGFFDAKKA